MENSFISAEESFGNSFISADESCNSDSPDNKTGNMSNRGLEIESMDARKHEESGQNSIFETWGQLLVMVPFTIAVTLFDALWANEHRPFFPPSFPFQLFFLITTFNFYISIIGILVWRLSPTIARGFHFIAFLCALLSLTILFEGLLPDELCAVPWILLALVISILCGLLIYECYFMGKLE